MLWPPRPAKHARVQTLAITLLPALTRRAHTSALRLRTQLTHAPRTAAVCTRLSARTHVPSHTTPQRPPAPTPFSAAVHPSGTRTAWTSHPYPSFLPVLTDALLVRGTERARSATTHYAQTWRISSLRKVALEYSEIAHAHGAQLLITTTLGATINENDNYLCKSSILI